MMFRFNFDEDGAAAALTNETPSNQSSAAPKRPARRHVAAPPTEPPAANEFIVVPVGPVLSMAIVNQHHPRFLSRTGELASLLTTSDIQTGVYEGGFKLWECAVDLIQYLAANAPNLPVHNGWRVLELGCGHGLPGLHALQQGAAHVTFSDYNHEVIELATIPNLQRNANANDLTKATFYSGDWQLMSEDMLAHGTDMEFDLILTAETIYTESVSVELFQTIQRHLKRRGGIALVAAKSYYFGTGGSVHHFKSLVAQDGTMVARTVWESNDAKSNVREIVHVSYA
ncbi:hypothetical protein H310_02144 [Aphanomyces invadans]|uniref:protein-histidine N-methyltransferase n=1 Tax=Aphanomyces invadans TaxID=157072 RepID=A0A024UPA8_9STRA|nr:hypothetical protein H310_02144 [Aphanomyces invadans]ETW07687.1 hypothetical protein H310_02144 [Aphanomyces invadans]|eukprot:XP_008863780.1 hypothetical protein H310_02144 [Aphanomyces invadans]